MDSSPTMIRLNELPWISNDGPFSDFASSLSVHDQKVLEFKAHKF
jgi:hypothetical protein